MDKWINYALKKGAEYVELKNSKTGFNRITVQNKEVREISESEAKIYTAKVVYKGKTGFSYSTNSNYSKIIERAIKNSKISETKTNIKPLKKINKKYITSMKIDPETISLSQKKKDLIKFTSKHKKIKTLEKTYLEKKEDTIYMNSDGTRTQNKDIITAFIFEAHAREGNNQDSNMGILRNHGGYETLSFAQKKLDETTKIAQDLLKAKLATGGNFPVIADQALGGVFVHEAIGHACEADIILNQGSVLTEKIIGKTIANEKVTIYDDGLIKENGYAPIDDEGVPASKTTLIKKGKLIGFLHSKETAARMDVKPTGNGRSQSALMRVIPRMTNTYMDKGDSNKEEMIKSIKKGYYLKGTKGGQVSPSKGEFIFNSIYGYKIENGKQTQMIKRASLIGNILNIMPKISLVAKDLKYYGGTCGKSGQGKPVSDGSPHIKIDQVTVGGSK